MQVRVTLQGTLNGESVMSTDDTIEATSIAAAERQLIAEWSKVEPKLTFRPLLTEVVADPNPIVRTTKLRAYPGWVVREYADGMFDATDGKGLSPGFTSFAETVAHLREEVRGN